MGHQNLAILCSGGGATVNVSNMFTGTGAEDAETG
jgi:hypothetical protein